MTQRSKLKTFLLVGAGLAIVGVLVWAFSTGKIKPKADTASYTVPQVINLERVYGAPAANEATAGEQIFTARFADVPIDYWYTYGYWYIEAATQAGYQFGCGDGSIFCPNSAVDRRSAALFAARAYGRGTSNYGRVISDVSESDPGYASIQTALYYGLMNYCDVNAKKFCPDLAVPKVATAANPDSVTTIPLKVSGLADKPTGYDSNEMVAGCTGCASRAQFFSYLTWNANPNIAITISGRVLDSSSNGVDGITVAIPGTELSTTTHDGGQFELKSSPVFLQTFMSKKDAEFAVNFSNTSKGISFSGTYNLSAAKISRDFHFSAGSEVIDPTKVLLEWDIAPIDGYGSDETTGFQIYRTSKWGTVNEFSEPIFTIQPAPLMGEGLENPSGGGQLFDNTVASGLTYAYFIYSFDSEGNCGLDDPDRGSKACPPPARLEVTTKII